MKMPEPKKLKKYSVSIPYHASVIVEVEATDKQDAVHAAWEKVGAPSLCHQCSDEVEMGEANDDCEPDVIELSGDDSEK